MTNKIKLLLAATASLVAFSASAVEPCKPYITADVGYSIGTNTQANRVSYPQDLASMTTTSYSSAFYKQSQGFIGAIGLGYGFNPNMRAEVNLDFRPNMMAQTSGFAVKTQEFGGSGTVIYDFVNTSSVTPFVFGGLGAMNIKSTIKTNLKSVPTTFDIVTYPTLNIVAIDATGTLPTLGSTSILPVSQQDKTVMTYKAGFGLAMKASDQLSVQLKYAVSGKQNYTVAKDIALISYNGTFNNATGGLVPLKTLAVKNAMDQAVTVGFTFSL